MAEKYYRHVKDDDKYEVLHDPEISKERARKKAAGLKKALSNFI